jgi:hypothetical protein
MAARFGPARAVCVRKKAWGRKEREEREKEKERKNGKLINLEILGEKNKR